MLLFVVLGVFLPCLPIFSSDCCSCTVSLVITLPDVSGFKAQMFAPCGGVGATIPVTPVVTWYFWRSLCSPKTLLCNLGGHLGFLTWRLLDQTCCYRGLWLGPAQMEVTDSGLLQWRLLTLAWSYRGRWLELPLMDVPDLGLIPRRRLSIQ